MKPMVYQRRISFYATVNKGDFLKDNTKNIRYWVIPVEKIDFNIIDNLDINMLWAEVIHLKEVIIYKDYIEVIFNVVFSFVNDEITHNLYISIEREK